MPKIACHSCHKRIRIPEHLGRHQFMCPHCNKAIVVPTELVKAVNEAVRVTSTSSNQDRPFPLAARLGILSLVLGMISFFLLCAPIGNYLSISLSSVGLLLALGGLFRARTGSESLPPSVASGVGLWGGFGTRVRDYPLAGMVACFVALFLTLLPTLLGWLSEQPS
jgi:hypothetical protein